MKNKIGQVFKGIIVSVTSFGLFVQLENTVEGLVKYEDIMEVIVAKVNEITNEINFYLNR